MVKRRAVLGMGGLVLASSLAGCGNLRELATEGELEVSATQATVETPSEWGYEKVKEQQEEIERTEQGQTVRVTNWLTHYTRPLTVTIDGTEYEEQLGYVGILSTPEINLGTDLNPVAGETPKELRTTIKEDVGGRGSEILNEMNLERKDTHENISILGTDAIVAKYFGDPPWDRLDVDNSLVETVDPDVAVYLSQAVNHSGDHIIAIGGHPRVPPDNSGHAEINSQLESQAHILDMFRGIRHEE